MDPNQQLALPWTTPDETDTSTFTMLLAAHGHLTRRQLADLTGWDERRIRTIAEAAGADVIRGQHGFCLFSRATTDEIMETIGRFEGQGTKMLAVAVELRRRLHGRIA